MLLVKEDDCYVWKFRFFGFFLEIQRNSKFVIFQWKCINIDFLREVYVVLLFIYKGQGSFV